MTKKSTPPALNAYHANLSKVRELNQLASNIQAQIDDVHTAITDAQKPASEARALKEKRRSLYARIFLKEATIDEVEAANLDSQIQTAEAEAATLARKHEGATAAIAVLEERLREIQGNVTDLNRDQINLRHAALVEYAEESFADVVAAVNQLAEAYAEMAGRCRAADYLVSPMEGRAPTGFRLSSPIDPTGFPTFSGEGAKLMQRDLGDLIDAAANGANQRIAQAA